MIPFYEHKDFPFYATLYHITQFPQHLHLHLELLYATKGQCKIIINNNEYILKENDLAIIFPNTIHSYDSEQSDCFAKMILCSVELTGEYTSDLLKYSPTSPIVSYELIHNDIKFAIDSIFNESKNATPNIKASKALMELILSRLLPVLKLQKNKSTFEANSTSKVISYVCNNFQNDISLDSISEELGISKFYISRIFSTKINISFNDYLNNLRVDMAKKLLKNSDYSILAVSEECGFSTQRSFNRTFKLQTNLSPSEYRAKGKATY